MQNNKIFFIFAFLLCLYQTFNVDNPNAVRFICGVGLGVFTCEFVSWIRSYKKNKNKSHTS